ncbi:CLUMA_CG015641, isoform A [Clunio marinus]|uniref:CLUMA_CG015641, isoform A n=1 Tax=Clunio marinus TaxID=568069 RepID=A0A1J1INV7_9DIPT|nr:CLUMA_CG015641, isoform A [Clunio marinus]
MKICDCAWHESKTMASLISIIFHQLEKISEKLPRIMPLVDTANAYSLRYEKNKRKIFVLHESHFVVVDAIKQSTEHSFEIFHLNYLG